MVFFFTVTLPFTTAIPKNWHIDDVLVRYSVVDEDGQRTARSFNVFANFAPEENMETPGKYGYRIQKRHFLRHTTRGPVYGHSYRPEGWTTEKYVLAFGYLKDLCKFRDSLCRAQYACSAVFT